MTGCSCSGTLIVQTKPKKNNKKNKKKKKKKKKNRHDSTSFPLGFEARSGRNASLIGSPTLVSVGNGPVALTSAVRFSGSDSFSLAQPLPVCAVPCCARTELTQQPRRLSTPPLSLFSFGLIVLELEPVLSSPTRHRTVCADGKCTSPATTCKSGTAPCHCCHWFACSCPPAPCSIGSGNTSTVYSLGVPQSWTDWATLIITISPTSVSLADVRRLRVRVCFDESSPPTLCSDYLRINNGIAERRAGPASKPHRCASWG